MSELDWPETCGPAWDRSDTMSLMRAQMLFEIAGFHFVAASKHDYDQNRHHRALERCSSMLFSKSGRMLPFIAH